MSAINKALSELAEKNSSFELEKAEISSVPKNKLWLWLLGGFFLSLALGCWAVVQSSAELKQNVIPVVIHDAEQQLNAKTTQEKQNFSPTSKITPKFEDIVYTKRTDSVKINNQIQTEWSNGSNAGLSSTTQAQMMMSPSLDLPPFESSLRVGESSLMNKEQKSFFHVERVELTHKQLAEQALLRAEKAMNTNELDGALTAYHEVLRYQPKDIQTRQKLAALYFGKGKMRKAYDLLQAGITLDIENQTLRLTLAKMLIKAEQPKNALSPLLYLPAAANHDYLAMRAILAQKNKQTSIALESYHLLVQRQPLNARWWLGLAIQQEREHQLKAAKSSYLSALSTEGISSQSQEFVQERLRQLQQQESTQ
ncbi:tetratricopeptide repeat protein [Vibrio sagamiensis]|uniref:MSHA biogenesis protein MshN n=1 Tax=Vibrio sagamiensis NBRC 104589 TaxID=1219064 RepID=A0A511QHL2_9VIBR|nr:MSHA biogenesis protein MshN [Vibrio sagamiensis]GEM75942.1 MSHA biogenesis protein MshN [Vibrio sagamiensis NBRC 104589]